MSIRIHIDRPSDFKITGALTEIRGWCASDVPGNLRGLRFETTGTELRYIPQYRPDVRNSLPGNEVEGFLIHLDLSYYIQHLCTCRVLVLKAVTTDSTVTELPFEVSFTAIAMCVAGAGT